MHEPDGVRAARYRPGRARGDESMDDGETGMILAGQRRRTDTSRSFGIVACLSRGGQAQRQQRAAGNGNPNPLGALSISQPKGPAKHKPQHGPTVATPRKAWFDGSSEPIRRESNCCSCIPKPTLNNNSRDGVLLCSGSLSIGFLTWRDQADKVRFVRDASVSRLERCQSG